MKYQNIKEEELKNKIAQDYFWLYDCTKIIGNVDFCVCMFQSKEALFEQEYLLWAEAKKGVSDVYKSLVQLILTIGKARTFDKYLPPAFLGAFDSEKIAFISYSEIHDIFYLNDFNWNVAPSNHNTKEFKLIYEKVETIINNNTLIFNYLKEDRELKRFIKNNFVVSKFGVTKNKIDKNNFITIYTKWLETVKPTIQIDNWEEEKKNGIIDCDFYLADLLSVENKTLREKLSILLKTDLYELNVEMPHMSRKLFMRIGFSDNQKAHNLFWAKYERPPLEEYWDYIVDHRHLLVSQDIRERKGSFYTPRVWVELSQKYLANVFGEDWQDEYYVWDCAAGTGNLLVGLTNKYNIWASTLDKADVDVMKDRIQNGANLLEDHVFQFDFLNDDFTKLPKGLQNIINDTKKSRKLIIYINPPYAEDTTKKTITGTGKNKTNVAQNKVHDKYAKLLKKANHELFAQFLTRIYCEILTCKIANFSTLKNLQSSNFSDFRRMFRAKLEKIFLVPADTFDNVSGQFPIGFFIWDTSKKETFEQIDTDVYDKNGNFTTTKRIYANDHIQSINKWIKKYEYKDEKTIGYMPNPAPDFQHNNQIFLQSKKGSVHVNYTPISKSNLIISCVYFTIRQVIMADWLNDRDQFLYPNDGWETDEEFQNDCLAYTLFNNSISSKYGTNHWIPFTEYDVGARDKFDSNFMTDFIAGKTTFNDVVAEPVLFYHSGNTGGSVHRKKSERKFSKAAKNVFMAGRKLWTYYHEQPKCNVNASLYDIREYFQERNDKGKMNNKSNDETYNELIGNLRSALKILAKKIEPKVYEYGFLNP